MKDLFKNKKFPLIIILSAFLALVFIKLRFLDSLISIDGRVIFAIFSLIVIYIWLWYNFIAESKSTIDSGHLPQGDSPDHYCIENCFERHMKFTYKTMQIVGGILAIIIGGLGFFGYAQYSDLKKAKNEVLAIRDSVKADYLKIKEITSDNNFRKIENISKQIDSSRIVRAMLVYDSIKNEYDRLDNLYERFRRGIDMRLSANIEGNYLRTQDDENIVSFRNMIFKNQTISLKLKN